MPRGARSFKLIKCPRSPEILLRIPAATASFSHRMSTPDAKPSDQQVAFVQMLFVQHTAALRGFVHALMPDFARADDVVQETFLTATKKAADFEPGTNFLGWVCSIARFKVLEAGRKQQ